MARFLCPELVRKGDLVSGHDIFISYSREDRPAARHFAESFAREGFTVWWDAAIRSGETFDEVIERELRASKAVVVLWSKRSVASRWVRAEATLADRSNKLVPVIIEHCDRPIIFELTHAAELADWTGDSSDNRWQTLVGDLHRLIDKAREVAAPASPAEIPVARPTPVAVPSPTSAQPKEAPRKAATSTHDELIEALERLKTRRSELSKPTPGEDEATQFYKQSDEYRMQESQQVHCLQILDGEEEATRYVVTPQGLKIGRTAPADIIVPGIGVSRSHCLVEMTADKVRVTDLNSTNGTYIDNKRIERSEILPVGSMLRVGNISFEHEVVDRSELRKRSGPIDFQSAADRRAAGNARS